ncbi:MAG: AAA family ATPase [Marinifilaceae bacterium]
MEAENKYVQQDSCTTPNAICSIKVKGLWGRYDFEWNNLNPDVNILIGINGSGKTTVFNMIDALFSGDAKRLKEYDAEVTASLIDRTLHYNPSTKVADLKQQVEGLCYQKVSTFDVPMKDKKGKKEFSQLYQELFTLVYDVGGSTRSFSDYRLKATNFPEAAEQVNKRISLLFATINRLFEGTHKTIEIDRTTNHLVFIDGEDKIPLHCLSSGEKQLLLILMKVFLMDEQPAILLMDEPEISLHIQWQHILFEEIRRLNPNCQIITSTHSPSLFGDGWSNKLVFVEDLITPTLK